MYSVEVKMRPHGEYWKLKTLGDFTTSCWFCYYRHFSNVADTSQKNLNLTLEYSTVTSSQRTKNIGEEP